MSTAAPFQVYPAIDVRGGRVVRLAQGDYGRETGYADDPLAVARAYAESGARSEEHTSELQSLMRISYAVFCLKKKTNTKYHSPNDRKNDYDNQTTRRATQ